MKMNIQKLESKRFHKVVSAVVIMGFLFVTPTTFAGQDWDVTITNNSSHDVAYTGYSWKNCWYPKVFGKTFSILKKVLGLTLQKKTRVYFLGVVGRILIFS
jgi:hypothetical protein